MGDLMLDEYVQGHSSRLSPEAAVPVVEVKGCDLYPGGAACVAANVKALGGRPLLCGVVGEDAKAGTLREALRERGIAGDGILVARDRPTTLKTRILVGGQPLARLDLERREPVGPELEEAVRARVEQWMPQAEVCILSDYGKGVVTPDLARHVFSLGRALGRPTVVDPQGSDLRPYRGATLVKLNRAEAGRAAGGGTGSLRTLGHQLLGLLEGSALLVTCDTDGMVLFEPGGGQMDIPAEAGRVVSVVGAGDAVAAALALALAAGASLREAARLASRVAAIAVSRPGTATVRLEELRESFPAVGRERPPG